MSINNTSGRAAQLLAALVVDRRMNFPQSALSHLWAEPSFFMPVFLRQLPPAISRSFNPGI